MCGRLYGTQRGLGLMRFSLGDLGRNPLAWHSPGYKYRHIFGTAHALAVKVHRRYV